MKAVAEPEVEYRKGLFEKIRAFPSFSVDDIARAKKFYGETLGMDVEQTPRGLELRIAGGSRVFVYGKSDHVPATFTVLNFPVDNVEKTVDELTRRGVRFEHYGRGEMTTDAKGIARGHGMAIAWFKDPAGNYLSVLAGGA